MMETNLSSNDHQESKILDFCNNRDLFWKLLFRRCDSLPEAIPEDGQKRRASQGYLRDDLHLRVRHFDRRARKPHCSHYTVRQLQYVFSIDNFS